MLEFYFIRTMLDILELNIFFQDEAGENLYTKEFIKEETCHVLHAWLLSKIWSGNNQSVIK